jgi:hypothetical protein
MMTPLWTSCGLRKVWLFTLFLATPLAALAQTDTASWSNLNALRPGQNIQITERSAQKHSGTFVSVSDSGISYQQNANQQTIAEKEVRSVKITGNSRLRHALIGAGIGAGAGAGITAAAWEPHGFLGGRPTGAAVGAVIGGLVGAVTGALMPGHRTIYHAASR